MFPCLGDSRIKGNILKTNKLGGEEQETMPIKQFTQLIQKEIEEKKWVNSF